MPDPVSWYETETERQESSRCGEVRTETGVGDRDRADGHSEKTGSVAPINVLKQNMPIFDLARVCYAFFTPTHACSVFPVAFVLVCL